MLGYPEGQETVGRDAIRAVFAEMLRHVDRFPSENPLPTLRRGDLALTSILSADNTGMRTQVVARQSDGNWGSHHRLPGGPHHYFGRSVLT